MVRAGRDLLTGSIEVDDIYLGGLRDKARGLLFYRLLEQAMDCAPVPRQMIIGGNHNI